ncbi:ABC transporter ATP-binding protein [uncultured Eudoraea sp.]|uniref:ABC transporter ATP-binding protein n=1 Tax=uncultured Eudoraea sp. TaxID=1035614 RepID=UPI002612C2B8|nr:ABC transporter ATP-binding protein [uncultured Eudoraea sp.]
MAIGAKEENDILITYKNFSIISTKKENIILEAKNLAIGYTSGKKQTDVADHISFGLAKGELGAIVGINGIGKSTLLRTLGRVQPKLSGSVTINNKLIESLKSDELATLVSIVLTEPIASKNLTVSQLISLGRHPYTNWIGTLSAEDQSKILKAIEILELESLRHNKCYELSDGQLQKVMIARALAQDTEIILLDEPTTHLDLYHKVHILKLLQRIAHDTNKVVLYTTHEIDLAIQLCDKIFVMNKDNNNFGAPCELIESKSFEDLFPKDTITFNPESGSFKINK